MRSWKSHTYLKPSILSWFYNTVPQDGRALKTSWGTKNETPQAHLKRNFLLILPPFDILKIPTTLFRPRLFSSPFLCHKFDYVCKRRAALYFSHFFHIITGWVFRGQMRKKLVMKNTKGLSMLIHLNFISISFFLNYNSMQIWKIRIQFG